MRVHRRRAATVVFGILAGALCLASVAWACTFAPSIMALSAREAPKGSEVTMSGQGVVPERSVELRWNAVDGARLAQTTADRSGQFSVKGLIPDVAPGVYSLMVVADGAGVGRAALEVTGDAADSAQVAAAPLLSQSQPIAPAWTGVDRPGTESDGTSSTMPVGVGLLTIGLVVLSAGSAVAVLRKRRAAAGLR